MISIGTLSFDIIENNDVELKVVTKEYDMHEDLIIYPSDEGDIEYVKSDNDNLKIEYSINKYFDIDDDYSEYHNNTIMAWTYCDNPMEIGREFIRNVNDKKIVLMDDSIKKITVYTNQENIDKLKNNWSTYLESEDRNREEEYSYQKRIDELEKENDELQRKLDELSELLDDRDTFDD